MAFRSSVFRLDGNVWDMALAIPGSEVLKLDLSEERRVVCTLNGSYSFQVGLLHRGDGNYFINLNKEIRKKTGIEFGDEVEVELEPDRSEYGLPVPEELSTAWELDPEGKHFFHQLTRGKQRSLIYVVGKFKSSEKRIEKSLIILEYLRSVQGKLDFKELNEAFRRGRS